MAALFSLSGLGICHKVADFKGCRPSAISVMLFFWAAAVLWGLTLFKTLRMNVGLFPPFTLPAVAVAVLCGACAGIAILTFQIGIRYGRISTSWLVINLSTIVPAILSLIIYEEWRAGIKWQQIAGLVLVLCSVVLLWRDKAVEIARSRKTGGGFPVIEARPSAPDETSRSGSTAVAAQEEA